MYLACLSDMKPQDALPLPPPPLCAHVWQESEFGTAGQVGGKATNCSSLASLARSGALPEWLHVPASIALPWGTFERVLQHPSNVQVSLQPPTRRASKAAVQHAHALALSAMVHVFDSCGLGIPCTACCITFSWLQLYGERTIPRSLSSAREYDLYHASKFYCPITKKTQHAYSQLCDLQRTCNSHH